jgi:phage gp36-like protein
VAYCTQADIENEVGGAVKLRQLADWDNDGVADADAIAKIIVKVASWIDSYARRRHSVPFVEGDVPTEIVELAAAEALYRIRKARRTPTDDERDDHVERHGWLKDLAAGRVNIALPSEKPKKAAAGEGGELKSSTGSYDSPNYDGLV